MYLVYTTDFNHSYSSRDLIGACTSFTQVMKVIRSRAQIEGVKLNEDDIYNLNHIKQTQGYDGSFEFDYE